MNVTSEGKSERGIYKFMDSSKASFESIFTEQNNGFLNEASISIFMKLMKYLNVKPQPIFLPHRHYWQKKKDLGLPSTGEYMQ